MAIIVLDCLLGLGMQSQGQAQEVEEKVTIVASEEGQKAEIPVTAPAQDPKGETPAPVPKEKAEALEKIVVTATRTERNPDDVPASITVITQEDIRKQHILTVDRALAQVPGAFDTPRKLFPDSMTAVSLRGFPADTQKRTLVLLDGQNISSAYTNSVVWSSMPVENIERIEVIRGPFSALYGGNAMGGVINIITKTAKKPEMLATGSYGTYDSWTYYLGGGTRIADRFSIQGGFNARSTSGYPTSLVTKTATKGKAKPAVVGWVPTTTTSGSPTNTIGDTGDNYWNDYNINGKISWDLAKGHNVTFNALSSYYNYGYGMFHSYLSSTNDGPNLIKGANITQGTVNLSGLKNTRFRSLTQGAFLNGCGRTRTQVYSLFTDHKLTDSTRLKFHGGLITIPENWYTTPGTTAVTTYYDGPGSIDSTQSKNWVGEWQVEQALGQKQQLVGGFSYTTGFASTKTRNLKNWRQPDITGPLTFQSGGHDRTIGAFLQDEIAWHPQFSTVAGVRLDWWQTYGGNWKQAAYKPIEYLKDRDQTALSPKLALLYRPLDWTAFRTSVGTAFRAPNIYELYRTWISSTGTTYKSNPALSPERTLSWELGATLKPFNGTAFTANYFENYVTDLIYRTNDPTDPSGKTQIFQNAAKATIRGFEIELNQKLWKWLEVFGNTTIIDARIRKNPYNLASVGKKITYVPRQQFNFGVTVTYWKIKANLSGRYFSKLPSSDNNSDVINNVYGSYDPFFTMDSKITFSPVQYADLSFAVDNLLNREYYTYYRTAGRMFWTQLTLRY